MHSSSHSYYMPCPSHLVWLIVLILFGVEYNL
jgi:hypothetical protein